VKATPRLHGDDEVTLHSSSISAVFPDRPSTAFRSHQSHADQTIRLRENQTSVLSGIVEASEARAISGLPLTATAPGAGYLTETKHRHKDLETLFIITPRALRVPPHNHTRALRWPWGAFHPSGTSHPTSGIPAPPGPPPGVQQPPHPQVYCPPRPPEDFRSHFPDALNSRALHRDATDNSAEFGPCFGLHAEPRLSKPSPRLSAPFWTPGGCHVDQQTSVKSSGTSSGTGVSTLEPVPAPAPLTSPVPVIVNNRSALESPRTHGSATRAPRGWGRA